MAKIAISLPDDVLQEIESERLAAGETRSEYFRRAVRAYFQNKRQKRAIEKYIQGYLKYPETEDEISLAEYTAHLAFAENPWESDDKP